MPAPAWPRHSARVPDPARVFATRCRCSKPLPAIRPHSGIPGKPPGAFGQAAGFSFFPTKVITSGEGGMILTPSQDLEQQARIYRDQGKGTVSANPDL